MEVGISVFGIGFDDEKSGTTGRGSTISLEDGRQLDKDAFLSGDRSVERAARCVVDSSQAKECRYSVAVMAQCRSERSR